MARHLWLRQARRGAGSRGPGRRANVPMPKGLVELPISWHGAGGLRTRGRVPDRAGGWSPIATGEREPPCQLRHAAGDAELLHAELQGGALQPQAHRRAVRPGHDSLRVAGKMAIMWSSA